MDGAIIDLDGTVYRGDNLLPGADRGVETLREAGVELLFFSNNPTKDSEAYADRLTALGVPATPDETCSAGVATTEYLHDHHADDEVLCIASEGLREQLVAADVRLTTVPEDADVLVVSWTPEFDYHDMQDALDAVDEETVFLGTDPDRTFPDEGGRLIPGSGAVVGAVAATIDRKPDAILGKPSETALALALDRLGVDPHSSLIVGDRLDTDLAMGQRAGMTTVLVLTGVSEVADIDDSPVTPDYVLDSLGDIVEIL